MILLHELRRSNDVRKFLSSGTPFHRQYGIWARILFKWARCTMLCYWDWTGYCTGYCRRFRTHYSVLPIELSRTCCSTLFTQQARSLYRFRQLYPHCIHQKMNYVTIVHLTEIGNTYFLQSILTSSSDIVSLSTSKFNPLPYFSVASPLLFFGCIYINMSPSLPPSSWSVPFPSLSQSHCHCCILRKIFLFR